MKPQRLQFTFNPWARIINVRTSRRFRQYHFRTHRRYSRFCFALMTPLLERGWHFCQEGGCVYLSAQGGAK